MDSGFLTKVYFNNSLGEWFIALVIIVGSVMVVKTFYKIFGKVIGKLTGRTKTKLDDIIVDMVEEPAMFALGATGVWLGIGTLNLPERLDRWLGNVFQIVIVLSIAWLLTRLLDSLYRRYIIPIAGKTNSDLDDQLLPILSKGSKLIIWGLAIVIALSNAGYDVGALLAGLGIGGLALAMAAKDTVSNFFGGVTVFADRPFTINDRVKINGFDGSIKEIGIRSTRLETLEGRLVTIPNSTFIGSCVENISSEPSRKIVQNFGMTYDTTSEQMQEAMELIQKIVGDTPDTEENILTGFNAFGDFSLNIILIYWIKRGGDILGAQSDINMKILKAFKERGLEFAFPTQTLYTKAT